MSSIVPRQPPLFPERICTKCGQSKLLDDFYVDKRTDKPFARCKDCHNAQSLARYHALHPKREKVAPSEKLCPQCLRVLPADAFGVQGKKPHLLRSWCRECSNADDARYREEHREELRAASRQYYRENAEECAERVRRSIAANPEKYQSIHRAWKQSHNAAVNSHTHKRRALLRGMPGVVSAWDWECIKARHDWRCLDCGKQEMTDGLAGDGLIVVAAGHKSVVLCRDHIIPLRPGLNIAANIAPRCRRCNSRKHRRLLKRREG